MSYLVRLACLFGATLWLCGSVLGQDSASSIEQSRLFQRTMPPAPGNITPDGMALPGGDNAQPSDDSFGAQQILKTQEKVPAFTLTGNAGVFYTSNVALTRRDTISDGFFVADAALGWTPRINREWQFQAGVHTALFRYFDTTDLDFESIGAGVGAAWTPANFWGMAIVSRYDFTELLDRHSHQILQDHEFSVSLQKICVLGRSHALSFGLIGSAGISDPYAEQRDQVGFAVGYHLQLTRQLDTDLGYRHSWYFYNEGGRIDLNQVLALGMHYHVTPWASIDGYLSGAFNYSNQSVFKYNVFSTGGGVGLTVHF